MQPSDLRKTGHEDQSRGRIMDKFNIFKTKTFQEPDDEIIRDETFVNDIDGGLGSWGIPFLEFDFLLHYAFIVVIHVRCVFAPLQLGLVTIEFIVSCEMVRKGMCNESGWFSVRLLAYGEPSLIVQPVYSTASSRKRISTGNVRPGTFKIGHPPKKSETF